MTDTAANLCGNAIKSMNLLHRVLGAWLLLSVFTAFLPSAPASAQLRLPFTEVSVPVDSARWACTVVIFSGGIACCAILSHLRRLCEMLAQSEHLVVVLTYPSIATLGTPGLRATLGYGFAFVQYSVGYQLFAPMPEFLGGAPDIGLAFLYASSMFWFAWELRDWQNRRTNAKETDDA